MLVTDAMAAMGMCEGEHNLGHIAVNVVARQRSSYKETDTSVTTLKGTDSSVATMSNDTYVRAETQNGVLIATVKGTSTLAGRYVLLFISANVSQV